MQKSQADGASDAVESPALYFFADWEQIGVNPHSGGLKKGVLFVRHTDVYTAGETRFNQITNCLRIRREFQAEGQIVEGPKRYYRQRDAGAHQSCGYLSDRPVSPRNDNQIGIFLRRLGGSSSQIQIT